MTAADVRDVLGLKAESSVPKPKKPKKKSVGKRADGITRELYSLIGDNAPSLTLALPKMKERPKLKQKAAPWEHVPFNNSARQDGLQLLHWQKKSNVTDIQDSKFAAFNTASQVFDYDDEEYQKVLQSEEWTREETDYLFSMCREYDLRFVVIHDRYAFPNATIERSLEDLKDRYYSACRRLLRERPTTLEETVKQANIQNYAFDKQRESMRKNYLKSLMGRTAAQIAEEEFLYVESRRLEQSYSRISKEREDLLRMLGGPGAGAMIPPALMSQQQLASLPASQIGFQSTSPVSATVGGSLNRSQSILSASQQNLRRRSGRGDEDYYDPNLSIGFGSSVSSSAKGKSLPASATAVVITPDPVLDALNFVSHLDPANSTPYGIPKSYNHVVGGPTVCLRSSRLPAIKPALQPRVVQALTEMGITLKLVMPTVKNQDRLENLVGAVTTLAELKRHADRVEYEIAVTKNRTAGGPPSAVGTPAGAEAAESVASEDQSRKRSASITSSHGSAAINRPPKKRKR